MGECAFSRLPLALRLQRRSSLAGFVINAAGAGSLGLYMFVVFPPEDERMLVNPVAGLALVALYTVIAGATAHRRVQPYFEQMRTWLAAGRPPTREECATVLRLPARFARMTVYRWTLAIPLFA